MSNPKQIVNTSILSLPQPSADFALDALAGDFTSSSAAPTVKSAAPPAVKSAAAPTVKSGAAPAVKSDASLPAETTQEVNAQVPFEPFWTF